MVGDVMNSPIPWLAWTGLHASPWKLIGLVGAAMFGGRWLVQFVASKRQGNRGNQVSTHDIPFRCGDAAAIWGTPSSVAAVKRRADESGQPCLPR